MTRYYSVPFFFSLLIVCLDWSPDNFHQPADSPLIVSQSVISHKRVEANEMQAVKIVSNFGSSCVNVLTKNLPLSAFIHEFTSTHDGLMTKNLQMMCYQMHFNLLVFYECISSPTFEIVFFICGKETRNLYDYTLQ